MLSPPIVRVSGDGSTPAEYELGMRRRRLHVGPPRDEPEPDRGHEADGRLPSQALVDGVRVALELLDRDRGGVGLDRAHVVVPSRIWSVFRSE